LLRYTSDDDSTAVYACHFNELAGIDQFPVRDDIHAGFKTVSGQLSVIAEAMLRERWKFGGTFNV
jgi:hypothetical protein